MNVHLQLLMAFRRRQKAFVMSEFKQDCFKQAKTSILLSNSENSLHHWFFFPPQYIQWKCIRFDVDENSCVAYEKIPVFILDKNPRKLGMEGLCLIPCSCALCS